MGKSSGSTSVNLDPATQNRQSQIWSAAQQAVASPPPGVNPLTGQAVQGYQNAANAGNLGFSALSGDPAAMAKLMNPYQQDVIDKMNQQFGITSGQVQNQINSQATAAGAFGGSRYGVASGAAQAGLGASQAQQIAGLYSQGYQNAQNQAATLANLGLGAQGQLANLGDYERNIQMQQNPALWRLQVLQGANSGMQSGSTTTQQGGFNPFNAALGVAGLFA